MGYRHKLEIFVYSKAAQDLFALTIGLGLGFGTLWPEEEGDLLAGLGRVAMKRQIDEQRALTFGPHGERGAVSTGDSKTTKKTDAEGGHHNLLE